MRYKKGLKNTFLLSLERVAILALNFILIIALTRSLTLEQFGTYSSLIAFASLFLPLTTLGLNNLVSKYFIKFPNAHHFYFNAALRLRLIGGVSAFAIGLAFAYFIYQEQTQIALIGLLLVMQIFNVFNLVEYYFLSQQHVSTTQKYRLTIKIIIRCLLIFAAINKANISVLIIIFASEYALIALAYLYVYKNNAQIAPHYFRTRYTPTIKRLFTKSKWLFFSGLAMILYLKVDQVMLGQMVGMEETAKYAAAAKLSEFWYVFPVLFANAFNALLTKEYLNDQRVFNKNCTLILSGLFASALILAIITTVIADPLIISLFGHAYLPSAMILSIHIWASIIVFQRAIFSKWLIITNNYRYSLYTHVIGAISNVLLNMALIPFYGGIGAAIASVISYALAGFISLFLFAKTRSFAYLMLSAMINFMPNCYSLFKLKKNKHG